MKRPLFLKVVIGLLAVALTAACSGPSTKINASMREFPQNVRIGDAIPDDAAIAPIPPTASLLTDGIYLPTARPKPALKPVAEAVCAPAKLGTTAALPVGVQPEKPPAPGLYEFRTSGKHTVGGASATVVDYPKTGRRQVGTPTATELAPGMMQYDFQVAAELGDNRTVTVYRMIPKPADDATPHQNPLPGLYVLQVATLDTAYKPTAFFTPVPPMKVMPFPAFEGANFNVHSVDPVSGVTVSYRGVVGKSVWVDACGNIVDSRRVKHTGSISVRACGSGPCPASAPTTRLTTTFTAIYDIALQYGAISVQDHVTVEGGPLAAPYSDDLRGVISTVPKQAK